MKFAKFLRKPPMAASAQTLNELRWNSRFESIENEQTGVSSG